MYLWAVEDFKPTIKAAQQAHLQGNEPKKKEVSQPKAPASCDVRQAHIVVERSSRIQILAKLQSQSNDTHCNGRHPEADGCK
eukprot:scaffold57231_cov17-Tisochrysis_lutea.AAC.1